jgi:hypothetical protein
LELLLLLVREREMQLAEHVAKKHRGVRPASEHGVQPSSAAEQRGDQQIARFGMKTLGCQLASEQPTGQWIGLQHQHLARSPQ